jgi:hypothetical protein
MVIDKFGSCNEFVKHEDKLASKVNRKIGKEVKKPILPAVYVMAS